MSSAQKLKANRENAQASTGPKTAQGKARAAQNARRHGLSLSILADPVLSAQAENLAHEIAGEGAIPEVLEFARRFAEAQIDLKRIRQARYLRLVGDLDDPEYMPGEYFAEMLDYLKKFLRQFGPTTPLPPEMADAVIHNKPEGAKKLAYILADLAQEFSALDRYERRALSRRKFAIRALDAVHNELNQTSRARLKRK